MALFGGVELVFLWFNWWTSSRDLRKSVDICGYPNFQSYSRRIHLNFFLIGSLNLLLYCPINYLRKFIRRLATLYQFSSRQNSLIWSMIVVPTSEQYPKATIKLTSDIIMDSVNVETQQYGCTMVILTLNPNKILREVIKYYWLTLQLTLSGLPTFFWKFHSNFFKLHQLIWFYSLWSCDNTVA